MRPFTFETGLYYANSINITHTHFDDDPDVIIAGSAHHRDQPIAGLEFVAGGMYYGSPYEELDSGIKVRESASGNIVDEKRFLLSLAWTPRLQPQPIPLPGPKGTFNIILEGRLGVKSILSEKDYLFGNVSSNAAHSEESVKPIFSPFLGGGAKMVLLPQAQISPFLSLSLFTEFPITDHFSIQPGIIFGGGVRFN